MIASLDSASDGELELAVQEGLDEVEVLLSQSVSTERDLVEDLTRHLAVAGGKRLRPLLTLV